MYSMSDSCSGKKIVQNKLLFWLLITSEKHTGPLIILHQLTFSSHYINDIKIYRIDDSRSTNREKLTTVCEKLTRSYMSLSSSLSEQERLLAEQNGQKDFTEIEEREQERVINFKALIRSFSTL